MVRLVEAGWVEDRLRSAGFRLVDPRRPVAYLQGHLPSAINVPVARAFDAEGRLLPDEQLANWLGESGLPSAGSVVLYDDGDGQSGAMLAWILAYLGHEDVGFLTAPLRAWRAAGREVRYRPVPADPAPFAARPRAELRATWKDVVAGQANLIDTRSPEEYQEQHVPGAVNIPWREFVGSEGQLLRPAAEVHELLSSAGVSPGRRTIAYCQTGPRAAVAFMAMGEIGFPVSLYDGSFADWSRRPGLPVEQARPLHHR